MQAAQPHLHARRNGRIINVSSIGGHTSFPFNSLYHGTKFALEGIMSVFSDPEAQIGDEEHVGESLATSCQVGTRYSQKLTTTLTISM